MALNLQTAVSVSGYEIDFFAVGDASRSGDAIVVRFGDLSGPVEEQYVVVVDGGFSDKGDAVVKHVREIVGRERVDLVISTHPDQDHVAGLCRVVEQLEVGELWMHLPWDHTDDIAKMFHDGRVTDNSVSEKLKNELNGVRSLANLATARGVPIREPFSGVEAFGGVIRVLGPSIEFYEELLTDFRSAPDAAERGILAKLAGVSTRVAETFGFETLRDGGKTSAENRTSVITLFDFGDERAMLTGDAGIDSLELAAEQLESLGLAGQLNFIQVPHHGSKHNVGPTILDRIIGPKIDSDAPRMVAYVSAAKEGAPKHPSTQVANAFLRRGAHVYATQGVALCHRENSPLRQGWISATRLPFYPEVDE